MEAKPKTPLGIKFFYGIFILTSILVIALSVGYYFARRNNKRTLSSETVGCPLYTCPGNAGSTGAWRVGDDDKKQTQASLAVNVGKK
jgi:hypothetical protein